CKQAITSRYNGLFGRHNFRRQKQLTDPRMANTHPAILSSLLGNMSESANHHLRSGLLPPSYMHMPSSMAPGTTNSSPASDLAPSSLLSAHSSPTGPQTDR